MLSAMTSIATARGDSVSFLVIADLHSMSHFAFEKDAISPDNIQRFNSLKAILKNIRDNYMKETDIVVAPGDVVSFGGWKNEKYTSGTGLSDENGAVYAAAISSYRKTKELYDGAGFTTLIACIGDHEIGGNRGFVVSGPKSKITSIKTHRRGWIDSLIKNEDGTFKFNDNFQGTSFAYRRNNSMFISVDVFKLKNNGKSNYFDRLNGYGGEGAITCNLDGLHATWFESVLKAARDDSSIKHIFVEAHVPIMHPVRKVRCSGQFLDDQTDSTFWRLMEEYNVDVYFAGEVHAVTASKSRTQGSNLVQIVGRGNWFSSFLTVEASDDVIEFKQYREVGPNLKFNNDYVVSGLLTVDKSNPNDPQISSSGELEILDDEAPLLHFDFEALYKIDERHIYGLRNDDSMVAKYQVVGDTNCTETIHNMGSFAEQYDAQVANIQLVQGRNPNTSAGKFTSNSRFGVFSIGPYTAGMAHSAALWMRTSESSKAMMLLYFGPNWKVSSKDSLQIMLHNGKLRLKFSDKDGGGNLKLTEKRMLADDQWHHIAVVMPFNSCRYSQLQIYIDGILYATKLTQGSDNPMFFATTGRLNIGGYGYREQNDDNGLIEMFEGEIDDVMVWSKPLQSQDVLMLLGSQSSSSPPTSGSRNCSDCLDFLEPHSKNKKGFNVARELCKSDPYKQFKWKCIKVAKSALEQGQDSYKTCDDHNWCSAAPDPATDSPTTAPIANDVKVIVCGKGEGCAKGDRVVLVDEIHKVRCCRDCEDCSSPWKQKCPDYNPELFALSKIGGVCEQGSFLEALELCGSIANGRLCTPSEIQNSCAKGTGCQLDKEMVWACAYDGHQCKVDADCCGSCVNGKCKSDGSRSLGQAFVQSFNDVLDPPILDERQSSSGAYLNLGRVFYAMSLVLTTYTCGSFL